jgi:hypothetical protein
MPDAQGLTGGNRGVGKWIEAGAQRGSCRAVLAAVVAGDLERADRAWKGIETTFAHQRADGGFEAVVRPTGSSAAEGGAAVETAYFFLQEYGRAILVIRQSPHEAHFRERIAALEPRLRKACAFLVAGESTILPKSRKAVNRVFIAAKAFGTCGKVLGDESLVAISRRLVTEALRQRDAEGVFIEHGGRDSSYNAVSILFGEVLGLHAQDLLEDKKVDEMLLFILKNRMESISASRSRRTDLMSTMADANPMAVSRCAHRTQKSWCFPSSMAAVKRMSASATTKPSRVIRSCKRCFRSAASMSSQVRLSTGC